MKRYDGYKNSNLDWVGEIPKHWEVLEVRRVTREHKQGFYSTDTYVDDGVKLLRITDINDKSDISFDNCPRVIVSDKEFEIFKVQAHDFLFARSGTIGRFGINQNVYEKAIFASYLIRFRFREDILTGFLKYYFLSNLFKEGLLRVLHGGANKNVHAENIKDQKICLPSSKEQTAIANYLDKKTAQIDDLIIKKQKLIDLLKEERTAIINQAVTKGIDPTVKLKPSGIEWLGDIPVHWDLKKLKYEMESFDSLRVPISADLRNGEKIYDYYGASGIIDKVPNYLFDGEFILLGEDGANLLTRNTALAFKAVGKFWVNNHAHVLKPKRGNTDYFVFLLEAIDYTIWVTGSAQPKLTAENLMNIFICSPPSAEQISIVQRIESERLKIDTAINRIEKEIELLAEYRTALISEVVTGKIDVRNEVF